MPSAVVLTLQAAHAGHYRHATGPGVHGWWFQRWQLFQPALAAAMHQPGRHSPFSLGPLLGLRPPRQGVTPVETGDAAWLRLACLSSELEAHWPAFLASLPPILAVDGIVWQVTGLACRPQEHPWANAASYDELRACLDQTDPPENWNLELASPTAFSGKKTQFPFPLPDLLVRSWLERWNAFAPFPLPEDLLRVGREDLAVTGYHLRTQRLQEGIRQTIGCTGNLSLRALEVHPALRAALDLLFHFAFYAGAGYHTTQGMGLMRLAGRR